MIPRPDAPKSTPPSTRSSSAPHGTPTPPAASIPTSASSLSGATISGQRRRCAPPASSARTAWPGMSEHHGVWAGTSERVGGATQSPSTRDLWCDHIVGSRTEKGRTRTETGSFCRWSTTRTRPRLCTGRIGIPTLRRPARRACRTPRTRSRRTWTKRLAGGSRHHRADRLARQHPCSPNARPRATRTGSRPSHQSPRRRSRSRIRQHRTTRRRSTPTPS
jgi:hypothetical protein